MASLHGLQRVKAKFPNIEVLMLTFTVGNWANRLVEPEEEADRLADHILNNLKVTIPVGIWKAKKSLNKDGGITPEDAGPNQRSYPAIGKPMVYMFDGQGRVRRIFVGYGRDVELQMARTIQFLEREKTSQADQVSISTPTIGTMSPFLTP